MLVALESAGAPVALPLLLASVALAAAIGILLVPVVGDRYLAAVGARDPARLSVGVLGLLVVVAWLFSGALGVAVFAVATALGLVPARLGTRRAHLMGVLMGPLMLE